MNDNPARSFSVENPTRLFSLDSENYNLQKTKETQHINLPHLDKSLLDNEDFFISPSNWSIGSVRSMDHRIKEAIKPVMENMEVLKPYNFNTLLNETHSLLVKEVAHIETREIKNSVVALIGLLQENADLINVFQRYTNWLQKA